jgi:serine phosphatase RsbU (regulator of sigma subunit)
VVQSEIALRPGRDDPAPARPDPTGASGAAADSDRPRRMLHTVSIVVLTLGLVVTATLALTARSLHDDNENHLLRQRVAEAGAVLSAAIPNLETPLTSGAVLAEATNADRATFTSLMAPLAGGRPFVSVSVWPARASDPRPLVVEGTPPEFARLPAARIRAFLTTATAKKGVSVLDLLHASPRELGYAYSVGPDARYVVYAESALPANRRAAVDSNSAFSDLDYAIYVGSTADPAHLLAASVADPRFRGRTASDSLPFGDTTLLIVMTPRRQLGGELLARLPWLIGGFGILIALAAALMTERLLRRRMHAEQLAEQNARLFSEQRSVAQTLQHSLLPEELPEFAGLQLSVRYVPGADGVEIGGDWYDVMGVDDDGIIFVVGDVSGRGLRAATVMASLRYAIRAYAAQGDDPAAILVKLAKLIDIVRDGHFATVLCGRVNVAERMLTIANAGHPNPLLIDATGAQFVTTNVGPPIGVPGGTYAPINVAIPAGATLLTYTDGLFERRGENPDIGLSRLRQAAGTEQPLDDLLDGLLHGMAPVGSQDDTAILGMRWRN